MTDTEDNGSHPVGCPVSSPSGAGRELVEAVQVLIKAAEVFASMRVCWSAGLHEAGSPVSSMKEIAVDHSAVFEIGTAIEKVRAAISNTPDGWREPDSLADEWRDGRLLPAVVDGDIRGVRYGKTSHVPLYGWCLADQGMEEFDLCKPSLIYALPQPPEVK